MLRGYRALLRAPVSTETLWRSAEVRVGRLGLPRRFNAWVQRGFLSDGDDEAARSAILENALKGRQPTDLMLRCPSTFLSRWLYSHLYARHRPRRRRLVAVTRRPHPHSRLPRRQCQERVWPVYKVRPLCRAPSQREPSHMSPPSPRPLIRVRLATSPVTCARSTRASRTSCRPFSHAKKPSWWVDLEPRDGSNGDSLMTP